ncbi:zinc-binding dehydrogenase [Thioclava kandeliae]|uniref:Zinc-binding dehydrogenase n=1 Tax=Thioclava kandeliae TaxID=3070818 RepID=A0ABV1SDX0_9RHOB
MTLLLHLASEFFLIIEETGEGITGFACGDTVYGMIRTGAFSDSRVVPTTDIARSPERITALVGAGTVTPYVERIFRLAEVRQALELPEAGRTRGKIVLSMG